jgi:hypothetical protein
MLTPEVIEVSLSSFSSPGISLVSVWPGREERRRGREKTTEA